MKTRSIGSIRQVSSFPRRSADSATSLVPFFTSKIRLGKSKRGGAAGALPRESWSMKTITSALLTVLAAWLWVSSPSAQAGELIFSQPGDNQSTFGPSQLWAADGVNSEVADEFNLVANIDRVSVGGFIWGTVNFQGVYVRFYAFGGDNKPGALLHEYFLAAGDPNVTFDQLTGEIDANLSPVFAATGRHFLSVQPVINYWYWWSANTGAPHGEAFYFRNNSTDEAWHHGDNLNVNINADVVFNLYGTVTGAGIINSLSATTLPRSGFLEIFGTNFGGNGTVLIGGIAAPVADWTSTRIVAYVPESAALATLPVQVISQAGASNTASLTVTTRSAAADHVNWRFRMNGPYSFVRPVIGPDGTLYSVDAFDHLYALTPDGGLKWLVRGAGAKGVAAGPDGTVYVASESFINAFNPDGSTKWQFVQIPRAFTCLGVSVGPDGNIYSVGVEGLGVFSLTPAGSLRWTDPEPYVRPIVDYAEIVFGPNGSDQQLYFEANGRMRGLRLDGATVFALPAARFQPAIGPDGSVHSVFSAYTPGGSLLWTFQSSDPFNTLTSPDVGSDGTHYFLQNLSQLFALNPDGSERWHATLDGYFGSPVVDPANTQLLLGSADTLDHAGFILSARAQDAHELWRVVLPMEETFNQFTNTKARFSADGQTAYIITGTATGDNNTSRSFVYSLNATSGVLPTPSPTAMPVATPTPVATATPSISPTPGATATPASSSTPAATPASTPIAIATPTPTPTSTPSPAPKAINLSTRLRVQTGDNAGIAGFIITGTAPKHLLIRGIGPSLTGLGIANALADPVLELHGPGPFATITNDNWRDAQENEIQTTGIPPSSELEPAIAVTLAPGAYTAIVRGNGDTSGIALVEVYDLNQGVDSKLANLSTRAFVSTGDNVVIAGFMLGGNSVDDRIVIRGIGPSLTGGGLTNALADPVLELRDTNGQLLVANNNWQDDSGPAAELIAAGLAPANNLEAAIVAALPPGLYTALLAGTNNSTGIGVVEVYDRGGTPTP
jgi:hypothetical protein